MSHYRITSSAGVELGIYEGETAEEALDAMARDAGYESEADSVAQGVGAFDGTIEEIDWQGEAAKAEDLDALLELIEEARQQGVGDQIDMSELPTYGGEAPEGGTDGVWSWDEDRLLVGAGADRIVSREEWAQR